MASDAGHHCIPVSVRLLQAVCISLGMSYADMELYNVRDSQVEGDPVPLKMLNLCGIYLHIYIYQKRIRCVQLAPLNQKPIRHPLISQGLTSWYLIIVTMGSHFLHFHTLRSSIVVCCTACERIEHWRVPMTLG